MNQIIKQSFKKNFKWLQDMLHHQLVEKWPTAIYVIVKCVGVQ